MSDDLKTFKRRAAGLQLRGQKLEKQPLAFLFAPNAGLADVWFAGSDLLAATFAGATIADSSFTSCALQTATFRGATLTHVLFSHSDLRGASFDGAVLRGVTFVDCQLEGASFLGARLQRPVEFTRCGLRAADLRFYESEAGAPAFEASDLRGVHLSVNCEFWNGTFDERASGDFGRVWARATGDAAAIAFVRERYGAEAYDRVDAYMKREG